MTQNQLISQKKNIINLQFLNELLFINDWRVGKVI